MLMTKTTRSVLGPINLAGTQLPERTTWKPINYRFWVGCDLGDDEFVTPRCRRPSWILTKYGQHIPIHAAALYPGLAACIPSRKFAEQPGLGHPPVACHRFLGYFQNLCRFFDTEPAKKPEFHHTALTRIDLCKRRERFIQSLYV